jgi:hypothetical protein
MSRLISVPRALACLALLATMGHAIDFQTQILPIFEKSCFECHSAAVDKPKAGLRLDDAASLDRVKSDPGWDAVLASVKLPAGHDDLMPPEEKGGPLKPAQVALLEQWIKEGAGYGGFTAHRHAAGKQVSGLGGRKLSTEPGVAAAEIDRLVESRLEKAGLKRTAAISDATFLRRVYLELAGRNPTADEAAAFLSSEAQEKRSRLIEMLSRSDAYVSRHFNYWVKVLRAESDQAGNLDDAWMHYLRTTLANNVPYDEWTRDMLTSEGSLWDDPAIGFYLRDQKNRLAGYEAMTGVFLGMDIGCAQCHDHPGRPVSQLSYFKMLGYYQASHPFQTKNTIFKNIPKGEFAASLHQKQREVKQQGLSLKDKARRMVDLGQGTTYDFRLHITAETDTQRSKVPGTYRYDDVKKGAHLPPQPLFGQAPRLNPGDKPMHVFAQWVTSPQNLRFTHVIANRMWLKVMGAPLLGPATDITPLEASPQPELARHLAELMLACGYDLKLFQNILMHTRTYQSEAVSEEESRRNPATRGPVFQRLAAEQAWDSLIALIRTDCDPPSRSEGPDFSFFREASEVPNVEAYWQLIEKRLDYELEHQVGRIGGFGAKQRTKVKTAKQGFDSASLARASTLPSPAPAGHFLQIFGQGQRQTIEDQWATASIPQALTLLNGSLHEEMSKADSAISRTLDKAHDTRAAVDALYLSTLARFPADEERAIASQVIADGARASRLRLLWVLINTTEFQLTP